MELSFYNPDSDIVFQFKIVLQSLLEVIRGEGAFPSSNDGNAPPRHFENYGREYFLHGSVLRGWVSLSAEEAKNDPLTIVRKEIDKELEVVNVDIPEAQETEITG